MQKINGLSVNIYGDKANPCIVFIHGFPYDSSMWNNQVEALKNDFYVVIYDIKGLGKSDIEDGQYTIESFTDDLFKVIDVLELKQPTVAGFSMGGYILFRAAQKDISKFGKLIFCDTKSQSDDDTGKIKRANLIEMINEKGLDEFSENFVPACFAEKSIGNLIYDSTLKLAKSQSEIGVKGCLLAMASRTDTTSFLSQINIPTLFIVGEDDKLTSVDVMSDLQKKTPKSKLVVIKNAGHMTAIENPADVNLAIKSFLL